MTLSINNRRITNPGGAVALLEISNPTFSGPMRIANDTADWISQGQTFVGLPFRLTLPEDADGSPPQLRLQVDNVGRGITEELESMTAGSATSAKLYIIDRLTPDVRAYACWLPLIDVQCTVAVATATAGVKHMMSQAACKQIANPITLPGIF